MPQPCMQGFHSASQLLNSPFGCYPGPVVVTYPQQHALKLTALSPDIHLAVSLIWPRLPLCYE